MSRYDRGPEWLAPAVSRLRLALPDGREQTGTAFLVSPTRALTCAHCILDLGGSRAPVAEATLEFTQARGAPTRAARLLAHVFDPEAGVDAAVLELPPVEDAPILLLDGSGAHPSAQPWRSFGYPRLVPDPVRFNGTIAGPLARARGEVLELDCAQAREAVNGISGAPLWVEGRVVGLVSEQLAKIDRAGTRQPAFDKLYATPIAALLERGELRSALYSPKRVFISYRRNTRDAELARELDVALRNAGHDVFIDVHMPVGTEWAEELRRQVGRCNFFIPVVSRQSAASEMMLEEVRGAHRRYRNEGVPHICPIRVGDDQTPLPFELAYYLGSLQYLLWSGPDDTRAVVDQMLHRVGAHEAGGTTPSKTPTAPTAGPVAELSERHLGGGTLPTDDPFYVRRSVDAVAEQLARRGDTGQTLLIQGARQRGKSSLLMRYVEACLAAGKQAVYVDFQALRVHAEYTRFLNDLAQSIAAESDGPEPPPIEAPPQFLGFMKGVLKRSTAQMVLVFDEVDRVVGAPYQEDFFGMLRSWHNNRANPNPAAAFWRKLDLALVISFEAEVLITNTKQSPFNVGTKITLGGFNIEECARLNALLGSPVKHPELQDLFDLLAGSPHLTRVALFRIATRALSVVRLVQESARPDGPFGDHLRAITSKLAQAPELLAGMRDIIDGFPVPDGVGDRLVAAGVADRGGGGYRPANLLYARFLRSVH